MLQFEAGHPIVIDDQLLVAMSRAWPHLRTLELVMMLPGDAIFFDDDTEPDFGTTISGLIALAKRCPELHTINVAIDSKTTIRMDSNVLAVFEIRKEKV